MNILLYLIPLIAVASVGLMPIYRPCEWHEEFGSRSAWIKLSVFATILGWGAGLVGYQDIIPIDKLWGISVGVAGGVLTVCTVFSCFTDLKLHKVDRRVLNLAGIWAIAFTYPLMILNKAWVPLTISIVLLFVCGIFYLFFLTMGASDVRTLALISVSCVPLTGYFGFLWGLIAMFVLSILFAIFFAVRDRTVKVAVPLAPLIMVPFLVVLLVSPFYSFSPAFS